MGAAASATAIIIIGVLVATAYYYRHSIQSCIDACIYEIRQNAQATSKASQSFERRRQAAETFTDSLAETETTLHVNSVKHQELNSRGNMGEYVDPKMISIKRRLGMGGFGEVYLATIGDNDEVAIKIFKGCNRSFEKECCLLAKLRHKCILQYYGHSKIDGRPSMITEYMERGSLADAIASSPLDIEWEVRGQGILRDVARGLAFLHRKKVIHSDLKPENILLDDSWNAKIGDVGISKEKIASHDIEDVSGVMNTNAYGGTDFYMAPEYFSRGKINVKSDIFSFGIILWQVFTGEVVHQQISPLGMQTSGHAFVKIPENAPSLVKELFKRCTRRNPNDRPSSDDVYNILS